MNHVNHDQDAFTRIFGEDPQSFKPRPDRKRIIATVDGEQNEGKTHFAGGCPDSTVTDPDGKVRSGILYQCFDKKSIDTIEKFRDGRVAKKKIAVKDYSFTFPVGMGNHCGFGNMCDARCQNCQKRASIVNPLLTQFHQDFRAGLQVARTIVWDHGAAVWEAIRFARFGRNSMIPRDAYGGLNWEFENLIDLAYESDCNLILLHRMGAEWESKEEAQAQGKKMPEATGRMVRKGAYSKLGFKVQAEVQVRFDQARKMGVGTIQKCQADPLLVGEEITNFDFFNLALTLAPNVEPSAWE